MSNARLAARLFGTGNVLVIHRFTLDLVNGDHLAALFLEQLVYWSERTNDPDGWIVKTYAEWEGEIGLSKYLVGRIAETLAPFGVETSVRRSPFHKMQPVVHYRVNRSVLEVKILTFIESENSSLSESQNRSLSESESASLSITEPTTETRAEVYAPAYEPPAMRLLRNDTLAQANGYTLVQAYSEVTGIPGESLWQSAKKTAAGLSRADVTPDDVRAFMAELRGEPDRYNGYRFNYLGEDLPRWKRQQQAQRPVVDTPEAQAAQAAAQAAEDEWARETAAYQAALAGGEA